jgi:cob(I)alamin adenosyltransferase
MPRIYTRSGDDGTTGLLDGSRTPKHAARLDAYGTVDELSATLGLAAVAAPGELPEKLHAIQHDLFTLGSHLALPGGVAPENIQMPPLGEELIARLEGEIDSAEDRVPALTVFILPGGSEAAARLHVARTVCRRAERLASELAEAEPVPVTAVTYLNRLSDWLFVHARLANKLEGVEDVAWAKPAAS